LWLLLRWWFVLPLPLLHRHLEDHQPVMDAVMVSSLGWT
jgi:hypothetical protein